MIDSIETLNIGPIIYKIVEKADLMGADADGKTVVLNGQIDYTGAVIELNESIAEAGKIITLWHELIHAMLYHAGEKEHDEKMVTALSYGLAHVIYANPDLVAATRKALSGKQSDA